MVRGNLGRSVRQSLNWRDANRGVQKATGDPGLDVNMSTEFENICKELKI